MNRTKRKRRRRTDKPLTGSEKVKVINMRTGKKVRAGSFYRTKHLAGSVLNLFLTTLCSSRVGRSGFLSDSAGSEGISGPEF